METKYCRTSITQAVAPRGPLAHLQLDDCRVSDKKSSFAAKRNLCISSIKKLRGKLQTDKPHRAHSNPTEHLQFVKPYWGEMRNDNRKRCSTKNGSRSEAYQFAP